MDKIPYRVDRWRKGFLTFKAVWDYPPPKGKRIVSKVQVDKTVGPE